MLRAEDGWQSLARSHSELLGRRKGRQQRLYSSLLRRVHENPCSRGDWRQGVLADAKVRDGEWRWHQRSCIGAKGQQGKPVDNPVRNVWVNETALAIALNTSYM